MEDLTQKGTVPAVSRIPGRGNSGVSDFKQWVADKKERVFDLDTTNNTHFDTYLDIANGKASMNKQPHRLVFASAKGPAPWL